MFEESSFRDSSPTLFQSRAAVLLQVYGTTGKWQDGATDYLNMRGFTISVFR